MWPNPQETTDLVNFTEEILNGKLHFFVQWNNNFRWRLTLTVERQILTAIEDCQGTSDQWWLQYAEEYRGLYTWN